MRIPALESLDVVPKAFRRGTHRAQDPEATLARARMLMPSMGITRIADVTGLDCLGIPVAMAYRPNSRSRAVSPGKGLDLVAAKASALMETIELWHAERIHLPLYLASVNELRFEHTLIDLAGLPKRRDGELHDNLRLLWIEADELLSSTRLLVPFELVHVNFTLPLPTSSGALLASSNGLASGNTLLEALSHALCELVERDAMTLWRARTDAQRLSRKLDLGSIDDESCRWVLERMEAAGSAVAVWDVTSDVGIPAFRCSLVESKPALLRPHQPGVGSGCHPSRAVALLRALTEAAQTRLTLITGSRDDIHLRQYALSKDADAHKQLLAEIVGAGARDFRTIPSFDGSTFNDDVAWELERLRHVGVKQVAALDLSKPQLGIPVVRVVVPGLESVPGATGYVPGARYSNLLAHGAT